MTRPLSIALLLALVGAHANCQQSSTRAESTSWQGHYQQSRGLAGDAHKLLRSGQLTAALVVLGEATDLGVPLREECDNGLGSVAAGLYRQLSQLDSDERYETLHRWTMPDASRPGVRVLEAIVPTEAPPAEFARAFGERPRDASFAIASVSKVPGLFSSAWELVQAAGDSGRLRSLVNELESLAERDIENAAHVLTLATIARTRRRDEQLIGELNAHLQNLQTGSSIAGRRRFALADAWQYGYGRFDVASRQTRDFTLLPIWSGAAWQAVADRPHETLGFLRVDRTGGHPAPSVACIRRWTSPADGSVELTGTLQHPAAAGDGVRASLISSRAGLIGQWNAHNSTTATMVSSIPVRAGDTLDLLVESRGSTAHDTFSWPVKMRLSGSNGDNRLYDSAFDFTGSHDQHVLSDAVLAAACLERDWLQPIGASLFETLVENTYDTDTWLDRSQESDSPLLRPWLRQAWATALTHVFNSDAQESLPEATPELWRGDSSRLVGSSWLLHDEHFVHLGGDDYLFFKYPLTGSFTFSCQVQAGGRPATDGGVSMGGRLFTLRGGDGLLAISALSRRNEQTQRCPFIHIGERLGGQYVGRPQFNRMAIESHPDRLTLLINGQPVWTQKPAGATAPWIALGARGDRGPMYRYLSIAGDPVIPRQVRLADADSLLGWNDEPGWAATNGVIRKAHVAHESKIQQSCLSYLRPLLDGESISYDFKYVPREFEVHPALGRLAFLIEPGGVRLHWITDGDREWTGLDEQNSVVVAFDRRGPKPLPLLAHRWNRMEISLDGDEAILRLNDKIIYSCQLDPPGNRTFGLYQHAPQTSVQVKNAVLKGDWPRRLTSAQRTDLAAIERGTASLPDDIVDELFDRRFRDERVMEIARMGSALTDRARYNLLAKWIFPTLGRAKLRMWGTFAPHQQQDSEPLLVSTPSPLEPEITKRNNASRLQTGGHLIAPAIDLVSVATRIDRLDELRTKLKTAARLDGQQAMLALINIADDDFDAANENLDFLVESCAAGPEGGDLTPQLLAVWVALRHAATSEAARELVDVMFESDRNRRLGNSEAWKRNVAALATHFRFENELNAFEQTVISDPLRQWQAVSHTSARSHGRGFPAARWQRLPQRVDHTSGRDRDYLYFQSPLQGDFDVECEVAATFGHRGSHLAYGATFTLAWDNLSHFGIGNLRDRSRSGDLTQLQPQPTQPTDWIRYRLAVRDGRMRIYLNGRLVRAVDLPDDHDPWLAIRNHWERGGAVRDLRITGQPVIPETIKLPTSGDLDGWLPYFEEAVGGSHADWRIEKGELIGRRRADLPPPLGERLLQYHRPMLEDGSVEYEFYYREGESLTHPAFDRLAFMLDGEKGVRIHRITDGQFERAGLDLSNRGDEPANRHGPAELPLRENAWNHMLLLLAGDTIHLSLNGQEIFRRKLETTNQRVFGLFHYADQSEVRVRNINWKGEWPKELPPIANQELAGQGTYFLDEDIAKMSARFQHDFGTDGVPNDRFSFHEKGKGTFVAAQSDGTYVRRSGADSRFMSYSIVPRCTVKGDFDITASFERFEPDLPTETERTECSVILSVFLNDTAQTRTHFFTRHVRSEGREDGRRVFGSIQQTGGPQQTRYLDPAASDADAGTLRVARRGNNVYFLFAEHDSQNFRQIGKLKLSTANLQPGGIQLRTQILGSGSNNVVWKQVSIQAEQIVDLAADRIARLQQQLTGRLPATALEFDGRTHHVIVPSLKYDGLHPITLEAFVTHDRFRSVVVGDSERSGVALGVLGKQYQMQAWSDRRFYGNLSDVPTAARLRIHLAGTFDGHELKVFVNGRLARRSMFEGEFKPSEFPFTIGGSPSKRPVGVDYPFAGIIDGLRVSKTVRYHGDFDPPTTLEPDKDTLAVYRFDEGRGSQLRDSSGNNHHGEIRGATWVSDLAIRSRAAIGITEFGRSGVTVLVDALQHSNPAIRLEAVAALGTIGRDAKAAIPALQKLVKTDDRRLTAAVRLAIARIVRDR